jgi:bacillithiol biosynthesis deacetylase BshB1
MVDLLAVAPHPDDAELGCGGTLARLASMGYKVGVVDLTEGESGTRGVPEVRHAEKERASRVLGLALREGLGLPDTALARSDRGQLEKLVRAFRLHRPQVVLAPHWADLHPDHVEAAYLTAGAFFLAGVSKFGSGAAPFRPAALAYYPGRLEFEPSFIVDISAQFETKMEAIDCYLSQFSMRAPEEPATDIAHPHFLEKIRARARHYGLMVGVEYGEPFFIERPLMLSDPLTILTPKGRGGSGSPE